jgi:hypothetical protein
LRYSEVAARLGEERAFSYSMQHSRTAFACSKAKGGVGAEVHLRVLVKFVPRAWPANVRHSAVHHHGRMHEPTNVAGRPEAQTLPPCLSVHLSMASNIYIIPHLFE